MEDNGKVLAFEYILFKLHQWYKQENPHCTDNDLSTLKVLKLIFFVAAAGTTPNSQNTLLDDVFDNFVAMPYGPVESDIYDLIKANAFQNVRINNVYSEILNDSIRCFDEHKSMIDSQINLLISINPDLVNRSPFELVELSHKWYSWKKNYNLAKSAGNYSGIIPIQEIKNEIKIYQ